MIGKYRSDVSAPVSLWVAVVAVALFAQPAAAADYGDPEALDQIVRTIESGRYEQRTTVEVGPVLRDGDDGEVVATVIRRLQEGGYLPETFRGTTYSTRVQRAVKEFQKDHGLRQDGLVGPNTSSAMNDTARDRLPEIRANLEKQKEFFSQSGDRFVLVNIPDARLVYFENGHPSLTMRVIVGKEGWGTPTMDETIETIVVNPDWDVPASIVASDLAPKVAADPAYLDQHNMVIYESWNADADRVDPSSIDWSSVTEENWSYRLRQLPGPENPLGQVKISFPNDQAIYLHGTSHDELFARNRRELSHGCIRMEKPIELAGELLEYGTSDWDTERLRREVRGNEQKYVELDRSVPVHLVYWTAFVDSSGELQLRRDIYDRVND